MGAWAKVKMPGDVYALAQWWFIELQPPYWYCRCRGCDARYFLPWDERWRTRDAVDALLEHGKDCAGGLPPPEENGWPA
jgi:hypothetical protein